MKKPMAGRRASAAAPLPMEVDYLTLPEWEERLQRDPSTVLAEIQFGAALRSMQGVGHPHALIDMAQLGPVPLIEVWSSRAPVSLGRSGDIQFARNDEIFFGSLNHTEADTRDIEATVRRAYHDILALIEREGFPNLLRIWNYFPGITRDVGGLDRYQCFCRGRFEALEGYYGEFDRKLPSASAVGTQGGGLAIYFAAAREAGQHRENPRQISAYHYPPQYGPKSPSFARATLKRWGDDYSLYISGTASIVGHQSLHPGDVASQMEETLNNLRVLIDNTVREEGVAFAGLDSLQRLKVYIRDAQHLALVRSCLDKAIDPGVPRLILQADICRTDLLLEIEGIARARS
jgi:chorismate lyase / 3-hydroxybenzoate synthase